MSYKIDLSHLDREGPASLTAQLVDRIAVQIDDGEIPPGAKLPTTRALASEAGINHLTAARVYRRLAELGYVTAAVGRGTFVRSHPPGTSAAGERDEGDWQLAALPPQPLSYAGQMLRESMVTLPGAIPLAAGFPAPELCPSDDLAALAADVLAAAPQTVTDYLPVEGLPVLRERLAAVGREAGFARDPEEILVTSGARQGIDLVARAILRPGDVAVVESPTFVGLLGSLEATGATVLSLPVDDEGADTAALDRLLARHEVRLVALQGSCQNPTGHDLSAARRSRLLELARERGFFILEDGVYATMRFDGRPAPRMRAEAPGHVVYADSLSKTLGGGLRVGWVAASGPIMARIAQLKLDGDLHSPGAPQAVAAAWLDGDRHARHLAAVLPRYQKRCERLLAALERHLGDEVVSSRPAGGHHVWVTLRRPVDERALYAEAGRAGVTFLPGGAAQPAASGRTSMRLSFSYVPPEQLDEGVRRLARALRAVRRARSVAATAPIS